MKWKLILAFCLYLGSGNRSVWIKIRVVGVGGIVWIHSSWSGADDVWFSETVCAGIEGGGSNCRFHKGGCGASRLN